MKKYVIYQIDSFTDKLFTGNPAGVVVNADGLTDVQMQGIARELNNSETAFFFSPDSPEYDGTIRYFTPASEVPICGHATIAALHAQRIHNGLDACSLRIKTGAGILPFGIEKKGDSFFYSMTQGKIEIDAPLEQPLRERLLDHLGLTADDLDLRCPVQIASTGHSKVMIGIRKKKTLHDLDPDFHRLKELSRVIGCNGYFVFTLEPDESDILAHGRMFAPAIGINEDPVTGNAFGPLGAYLVWNRIVDANEDSFRFKGKQGEKMGREGTIEVHVLLRGGEPVRVKILGDAVTVFKTELEIQTNPAI